MLSGRWSTVANVAEELRHRGGGTTPTSPPRLSSLPSRATRTLARPLPRPTSGDPPRVVLLAIPKLFVDAVAVPADALLILSPLPSALSWLKLSVHSHLADASAVLGAIASQKRVLHRGLGLLDSASASVLLQHEPVLLWTCTATSTRSSRPRSPLTRMPR